MVVEAAWHGTGDEAELLRKAIAANCECTFSPAPMGLPPVRTFTCAAHDALVHDQRFLDGLVFMRRKREILELEERKR